MSTITLDYEQYKKYLIDGCRVDNGGTLKQINYKITLTSYDIYNFLQSF